MKASVLPVSSALCKNEYDFHRELSEKGIPWTAGIHPYYHKSSERDFQALVKLCDRKEIIGIGEIGLDSRNPDSRYQEKLLRMQLDLARSYNLPVVLHVVKNHERMFHIIRNDFPQTRGIVHGFYGSAELFESYRRLGLLVSIGGRITSGRSRLEALKQIVRSGKYFFETDAPYQKPGYSPENSHTPRNLLTIIHATSTLTSVPLQELAQVQSKNFRELFDIDDGIITTK